MLPRGSAIGMISSAAGLGWQANLRGPARVPRHHRLRRSGELGAGQQQGRLHVEQEGDQRLRRARGVRLPEAGHPHQRDPARARPNTPLAQANAEMWLGFGSDYREAVGIEASTPLEQAYPLRLPLQRRGVGRQRRHGHHRRGLRQPPVSPSRSLPRPARSGSSPASSELGARDRTRSDNGGHDSATASAAHADERVVLDVGRRRPAAHPGLRRLRHARPPAGADLPGVPQPVVGARRWSPGAAPSSAFTVNHHQWLPDFEPPYVIAIVAPRRGPDRAPHDQHRRLRPGRRAHRPGGRASASSSTTTCGCRCSSRPARPTPPTGVGEPERPAPRAAADDRPLRAPRGALGRRPLGDRPAADGRPAVADRRRVPRRGRRRRSHARRHRRAVDLSRRGGAWA